MIVICMKIDFQMIVTISTRLNLQYDRSFNQKCAWYFKWNTAGLFKNCINFILCESFITFWSTKTNKRRSYDGNILKRKKMGKKFNPITYDIALV